MSSVQYLGVGRVGISHKIPTPPAHDQGCSTDWLRKRNSQSIVNVQIWDALYNCKGKKPPGCLKPTKSYKKGMANKEANGAEQPDTQFPTP